MNNISMIAAVGRNLELGKDNQLIWHLKEDLKFFKKQTINKPIVMGRKTLESLPGLLPNRKHIVLTGNKNYKVNDDVMIVHSKEELLKFIESYKDEVMIIGGASLYKEMLEYAYKLILTEIDAEAKDADSYFPYFDKNDFNYEVIGENEENNIKYKHLVYKRK